MIKQIATNLVYVSGPKKSAIYNFADEKVYSINEVGTSIISRYMSGETLNETEISFLTNIKKLFGISEIEKTDYIFSVPREKKLNFVWLELTQLCGNRCIHCYEGECHKEAKNPLTHNDWKQVISDIAKLGCNHIQFIGGEPTLYKNLPDLLDYSTKLGIKEKTLFTNLYDISDSLIQSMRKNNVEVHFSIYGSTAIIHDAITQVKGSFNRLIQNIIRIKQSGISCKAHIVVMRENEEDRDNMYSFLNNLGITKIKSDEIRKVYGGCQDKHLLTNSRQLRNSPNFSCSKAKFDATQYRNTCWYGKCVVSTDGTVYPCEFDHITKYGNVRDNSLLSIIEGETIDKYWYLDYSKVETCKDCEFRFACKDCRPLAFAKNGNLYEKAEKCTYDPYTGKW